MKQSEYKLKWIPQLLVNFYTNVQRSISLYKATKLFLSLVLTGYKWSIK